MLSGACAPFLVLSRDAPQRWCCSQPWVCVHPWERPMAITLRHGRMPPELNMSLDVSCIAADPRPCHRNWAGTCTRHPIGWRVSDPRRTRNCIKIASSMRDVHLRVRKNLEFISSRLVGVTSGRVVAESSTAIICRVGNLSTPLSPQQLKAVSTLHTISDRCLDNV